MGTKHHAPPAEQHPTDEHPEEAPANPSAPNTARHSHKDSKHSRTDSKDDKHLRRGSGIFGSGFFLTRRLSRFGSGPLPPTDAEHAPEGETSGVPTLRNIQDCIHADQANMALVTYNPAKASPEYRYSARGGPTRLLETMSPKLMQAVQQVPLLRNIAYRVEEIPHSALGHRASMRAAALRRAAERKGYLAPTAAQLQRQRAMVEEGKVPPSGSVTARSGYNTHRAGGYPTYRSSNLGHATARGGSVTARGDANKMLHDVPFHEAHKLMTSRTLTVEGKPMWR